MAMPLTQTAVILMSTGAWLAVGVRGHIGEPCNSLLRVCLPPNPTMVCASDFRCRCKPDFPVEILPHTCKAAKRIGQRCSHLSECTHTDPNSFCTTVCSCSRGFTFSYSEDRCVADTSPKGPAGRSDKWFLPSTIGFSLICLGIAFCFSFFWYFFCRQPPESWEEQMRHRETRAQIVRLNDRSAAEFLNVRSSSGSSHLPTYDSAIYDQPPSYEEAVQVTTRIQIESRESKDCDSFVSPSSSTVT